jgi:hypothetical protein
MLMGLTRFGSGAFVWQFPRANFQNHFFRHGVKFSGGAMGANRVARVLCASNGLFRKLAFIHIPVKRFPGSLN